MLRFLSNNMAISLELSRRIAQLIWYIRSVRIRSRISTYLLNFNNKQTPQRRFVFDIALSAESKTLNFDHLKPRRTRLGPTRSAMLRGERIPYVRPDKPTGTSRGGLCATRFQLQPMPASRPAIPATNPLALGPQ